MLHHILHCFSFFVLCRQNDRQINGNTGIGTDCPTPKISARHFRSMGCLKRKLEHWKHKTWIPKAPRTRRTGIFRWSFEVALEGAGERIRGIHVPFSESRPWLLCELVWQFQFSNHNNLFEFGDNCITCVQLYHAVSSTHCYTIHPWKFVNIQPSRWIRWSMTSMQRSSGFPMASCHGGMRSWMNLWVCWAHHRTFCRMARRNSRILIFWLKKGTYYMKYIKVY